MSDIPAGLKAQLEERIRAQIASEVRGEVQSLYEFTLPQIRASRIAERSDEPELTYSEIRRFVREVREAEVLSVDVEQFHPSVARFANCPAAKAVTKVRYNGADTISVFRCIWVFSESTWYTTALGKICFSAPDEPTVNAP
jgi:hypothetical protein